MRASFCSPGSAASIAEAIVSRSPMARTRHLQVGRHSARHRDLLGTQPLGGAILNNDAVAGGNKGGVVGRTGIGAQPQHHTRLRPGVRIRLAGDMRADGSVGRERLRDKVELITGAPDVIAPALHGPVAAAQRLATGKCRSADIRAAPTGRTRWRRRRRAVRQNHGIEGDGAQRHRIV